MSSRGSWRQTIDKSVLVVGAMIFLVLALIYLAYQFKWDWTGFNERIGPNVQQYQPSKTIWDWLQLLGVLAIPVMVGFGTLWFTAKQGQISENTNKDNQREMALQAYINKMSELILANHLRKSQENENAMEVKEIA